MGAQQPALSAGGRTFIVLSGFAEQRRAARLRPEDARFTNVIARRLAVEEVLADVGAGLAVPVLRSVGVRGLTTDDTGSRPSWPRYPGNSCR